MADEFDIEAMLEAPYKVYIDQFLVLFTSLS